MPPASSPSNCSRPRRAWSAIARCAARARSKPCCAWCASRCRGSNAIVSSRRTSPRRVPSSPRAHCAGSWRPDSLTAAAPRPDKLPMILAGTDAATHIEVTGSTPLIISVPHAGTALPEELAARLTPLALTLPDTDWHVAALYDFAPALGATMLVAQYSRYLIALNGPPDDAALYSAAPKTGLCPTRRFAGEPLYLAGDGALDAAAIERRREQYWLPYHPPLSTLLTRTRDRFGYALLLDAHSIRSVVPRLFEGRLPHINVGTNQGSACTPALAEALSARIESQTPWSGGYNRRLTGGYIHPYYGRPAFGGPPVQIGLAQSAYMDESGASYEPARAAPLRELLGENVAGLLPLPLKGSRPGRPRITTRGRSRSRRRAQ